MAQVLIFMFIFGSIQPMNPEEKELLERSVELGEENNKMLHSMRRSMRLARIMSILYWVVIVGSAVGAYYLIQPYIDMITGVYGGAVDTVDVGVSGMGGFLGTLKDLLN